MPQHLRKHLRITKHSHTLIFSHQTHAFLFIFVSLITFDSLHSVDLMFLILQTASCIKIKGWSEVCICVCLSLCVCDPNWERQRYVRSKGDYSKSPIAQLKLWVPTKFLRSSLFSFSTALCFDHLFFHIFYLLCVSQSVCLFSPAYKQMYTQCSKTKRDTGVKGHTQIDGRINC